MPNILEKTQVIESSLITIKYAMEVIYNNNEYDIRLITRHIGNAIDCVLHYQENIINSIESMENILTKPNPRA